MDDVGHSCRCVCLANRVLLVVLDKLSFGSFLYQTHHLLVPEPTSVKSPTLASGGEVPLNLAASGPHRARLCRLASVHSPLPTIRDHPLSVGSFRSIQLNLPALAFSSVLGLWALIVRVSLIAQDGGYTCGERILA